MLTSMLNNDLNQSGSDSWYQPPPVQPQTTTPAPAPSPMINASDYEDPNSPSQDTQTSPGGYTPPVYQTPGTSQQQPNQTPQGAYQPSPDPASTTNANVGQPDSYDAILQRLQAAPDDHTRAIERDNLSRQLQQDLEGDGHKVTWQPDGTMLVDGRPYTVGAGGGRAEPGGFTGQGSNNTPGYGGPAIDFNREGFRDDWLGDPADHQSAGDLATFLQQHPEYAAGVHLLPGKGDKAMLVGKDGRWGTADDEPLDLVIGQGLGGRGPGWTGPGGGGGAAGGAGSYAGGSGGFLSFDGASGGWAPGRNDSFDGMFDELDPNAGGVPSYDDIYNQIASADPNEARTQRLVGSILDNPESLDDRTVEMMKSKNAEEFGLAQQAQDEELQHFGAGANLMDSPWLASARADNAWNRRNATIDSNRTIDLTTAQTRAADKRSAAQLGQSYGQYRTGKVQTAINTAVESTLGKLGEQRSRTQVNNAFKQAAKQLGMSADQLRLQYISINNNYGIDMAKLAEQSTEFQQELAERIAARRQQDDQFGANLELDSQKFQHQKDQDYWQRARDSYAPRTR
jgi:hypothetical protein